MTWINEHILSMLIFAPLLVGLLIMLANERYSKWIALLGSFGIFILSLHVWCHDVGGVTYRFVENYSWISSLGINFHVGMDGFSLWLIILTTLLSLLSVAFSMQSITESQKSYYICLMLLLSGMLGALVSLDVFLFYVFWEAMLIPMYFIIGIWGGKDKDYAAHKFFIFTLLGSMIMLVAIFYLYFRAGQTFDLATWLKLDLSFTEQSYLFAAFALSFAVKVPMFPFHTWLPDAHVQAPTAGSVILAGILLKMGTYGFVRFAMPLFPDAFVAATPCLTLLSVIGIIFGALVAMVQDDIKKLVAYSSVSHLGFVMLGLLAFNQNGIDGAVYQMLNHGISTGALFLLIGMIYDRTHTREIRKYGGIAKVVPIYTVIFLIVTFSSIGLPGTNGFIGEFLILSGAFKNLMVPTIFAASGVVLGAVYMLWMVERVFFGPKDENKPHGLTDLKLREVAIMVPLLVLILWMGVKPSHFMNKISEASGALISSMETKLSNGQASR